MSVFTPGWKSAARVYRLTSPVVSKLPNAPPPLACTFRSGTRSRLKCAIWLTKWKSCSRIGPSDPTVSENWSLGAGAPVSVVDVVGEIWPSRVVAVTSVVMALTLSRRGWAERMGGIDQELAGWIAAVQSAQVPQ